MRLDNFPTMGEVAMIIEGPAEEGRLTRDIVLHTTDDKFKKVSDLRTGYLALQYPVLFPWGSHGYNSYNLPIATRE